MTAEKPTEPAIETVDDDEEPLPHALVGEVNGEPLPGMLRPTRRVRTFDALLDVPVLRWYFLSMVGNWSALQMQQVVRGYLAFQLTGSYAALGGVALANSLPRLVLALFGGVVADRASRRYVMQIGQAFNMALTGVIAALLFADQLRLEHLLITAALHGVSNSFSQPARQAMIPELVGPERLTNAIGLNVSVMNTMRLTAPALGGFLLAWFGGAWVYVLMTVMYFLGILAMFKVPARGPRRRADGERSRSRTGVGDIVDGFRYLRYQPVLVMLLTVHLFIVLLSQPFQRLLPGFVAEILASDAEEAAWRLGLMLWFMGLGALVGSLIIASLPNRRRGALLIGSMVVFGLALLGFAASDYFWLSAGVVVLLGLGQAGRQSLSNILIQTHVTDQYRGRISSIMMMEMGLDGIGVFGIALLAAAIGIQLTLGAVAVGMILLAAIIAVFLPAYRRLQ